jgi:hypothetical protein
VRAPERELSATYLVVPAWLGGRRADPRTDRAYSLPFVVPKEGDTQRYNPPTYYSTQGKQEPIHQRKVTKPAFDKYPDTVQQANRPTQALPHKRHQPGPDPLAVPAIAGEVLVQHPFLPNDAHGQD